MGKFLRRSSLFASENEERNMVDFFKVVVDNLHLENMCFCGVFCYQKHCLISSLGFSKKTWSTHFLCFCQMAKLEAKLGVMVLSRRREDLSWAAKKP